jgi:type II secretory pathway pseudopilin PulG
MDGLLLVLILVVVGAIALVVWNASRNTANRNATSLADAKADARRVIDRLGGQVLNLSGTDDASKQAIADASERFNAAGAQIDQATTAKQALLAKESAMEGLYYVRAARTAMGMDPGPELESLSGQQSAGTVTEDRRVEFEGRQIEASPNPTERTPNYYPGGRVAGRPVPAGWYSEPWWKPALVAGAWGVGSVFLFSALFSGMAGVGYDAQGFENGYGDGYADGLDAGQDGGDYGDGGGDMGGDGGGDGGGWGGDSWGGGDGGGWGGGDFGGGDFGGDFGGF